MGRQRETEGYKWTAGTTGHRRYARYPDYSDDIIDMYMCQSASHCMLQIPLVQSMFIIPQ